MTATTAPKSQFNARGFGTRSSVQPFSKPTARYPGAIAGDADLAIAVNRLQTTLAVTMAVTDTVMTVQDASSIVVWSLLSIDNEIVKVVSIATGNQLTVTRGFDGTTAAIHLAGASVSGFIDAYHHNTLVAEIEAIEQTLGANLQNVPAVAYISAPAYNFPPQTPGGSLTVGTNQITLAPVPLGVNGTDTNHYLYISGGTGTAEAVPITGGSAVEGQTSGIIFVTCANTHSGAWTIRTATAGAQEAHNHAIGPVNFPAGTFDWYGPFWSNGNASIFGAGNNATTLRFNSTTMRMFNIQHDWFVLMRVGLLQVGTPVSGNVGIYTAGSGSSVAGAACSDGVIEDLNIFGFYNGIITDGGSSTFTASRINVNYSISDGIVCGATQGFWDTIVCVQNQGNGITIKPASSGSGGGPTFMQGIETYNNKGWGIYSTTGILLSGHASFLNNDFAGELYVSGSPTLAGFISDTNLQYAGQSISWGTNTGASAVVIGTGTGAVRMSNLQIFSPQGNGVVLNSGGCSLSDSIIIGAGAGNNPSNPFAVTGSNVALVNNNLNGPVELAGNGNVIIGNIIGYSGTRATLRIDASSQNQIISNNAITQSGTGVALQLDTGVTYQAGNNIVTGTVTNNGTKSAASVALS